MTFSFLSMSEKCHRSVMLWCVDFVEVKVEVSHYVPFSLHHRRMDWARGCRILF